MCTDFVHHSFGNIAVQHGLAVPDTLIPFLFGLVNKSLIGARWVVVVLVVVGVEVRTSWRMLGSQPFVSHGPWFNNSL